MATRVNGNHIEKAEMTKVDFEYQKTPSKCAHCLDRTRVVIMYISSVLLIALGCILIEWTYSLASKNHFDNPSGIVHRPLMNSLLGYAAALLVLAVPLVATLIALEWWKREDSFKTTGIFVAVLLSSALFTLALVFYIVALLLLPQMNEAYQKDIRQQVELKGNNADVAPWFQQMQKEMSCCGFDSLQDYKVGRIPISCCDTTSPLVTECRNSNVTVESKAYYQQGCWTAISAKLSLAKILFIVGGAEVVLIAMTNTILTIYFLVLTIRASNRSLVI
jgi:hypothetical protein